MFRNKSVSNFLDESILHVPFILDEVEVIRQARAKISCRHPVKETPAGCGHVIYGLAALL